MRLRTLLSRLAPLVFVAAACGSKPDLATDLSAMFDGAAAQCAAAAEKIGTCTSVDQIAAVFDGLAVSMPKLFQAVRDRHGADRFQASKQDAVIMGKIKAAYDRYEQAFDKLSAVVQAYRKHLKDQAGVIERAVERWLKAMEAEMK